MTFAQAERWTAKEKSFLEQFSLSALKSAKDTSNQYLNNPDAIKLGRRLFNETGLSNNKKVACASCHLKEQSFTDNKTIAIGARSGLRNTPTLINAAHQNWFFWDGSKDSLWAQAISSMENPAEHNFSRVQAFHFISSQNSYRQTYQSLFKNSLPLIKSLQKLPKKAGPNGNLAQLKAWKKLPKEQRTLINRVTSNIGKAIASYVSTITTTPTRFDRFLMEMLNQGSSTQLSESELRGLKLFISKRTGCANCHSSPLFSNKEFHNIGTGILAKDNGRSEVIDAVIRDPFNCLGDYSDAKPDDCMELKFATTNKHSLSGAYKTPTLRGLSKTAPYMHDGRFKNLKEVLRYYAGFNSKEKILTVDLPVISLSEDEQIDIVNFLLSL